MTIWSDLGQILYGASPGKGTYREKPGYIHYMELLP